MQSLVDLNVVAVVSDMGSNNLQMMKKLNICEERPFFHVNSKKIVYLSDVPHIFKAIRNMLLKYDFIFDGKTLYLKKI